MDFIEYIDSTDNICAEQLDGFFVGWASKPTQQKFLQLLNDVKYKVLAYNRKSNKVIGFIYAITDNVICAYIPLLEVLPEFQDKGIGNMLISTLLNKLKDYYMIDLCCDENLSIFYKKKGFKKVSGMIIRNYKNQSGM